MVREMKPMPAPETIKCWACKDKGIIIMREIKTYKEINESFREEYALYCSSCGEGNDKYYHGKNNTKYKTEYYTASISSQVDIDKLKMHNKFNYVNGNYINWYKYKFEKDDFEIERQFLI